jgi:hypothetical protein
MIIIHTIHVKQILTRITIPQKGEKWSPVGGNFGGVRGI